MNKKLIKLLSVFLMCGVVGAGAAGLAGCKPPNTPEGPGTPGGPEGPGISSCDGNHTYNDTWTPGDDSHWKDANCGHELQKDEAAHVDANNDNKCDVCLYDAGALPAAFTAIASDANCIKASTFMQAGKLPTWEAWGNGAGFYSEVTGDGAQDTHGAIVKNGKVELVTSNGPTTSMYLDFGTLSGAGVISGYMEIKGLSGSGTYTPIQFYGKPDTKDTEIFGLRRSGNTLFPRIWTGVDGDGKNIMDESTYSNNKATLSNSGDLAVAFTFNTATKELTVTAGGSELVKLTLVSGIKGIRFCSGGGNESTFKVDNVAVKYAVLTADEYKAQVNEKVAALEEDYSLTTIDGYADIKTAYTAALGTATNFAEIDSAYATYETAVLAAYKTAAKTQIDTWFPASSYTSMASELAGVLNPIKQDIDEAGDLATVKEKANQTTIQAALTDANVRTDEDLNQPDIIIALVDDTNASVGGIAKGTLKNGDKITEAQLKAAVTASAIPAGKKIGGFKIGSTDLVFGADGYTLDKTTGTGTEEAGYTVTITVVWENLAPQSFVVANASDLAASFNANTTIIDGDLFSMKSSVKLTTTDVTEMNGENANKWIKEAELLDGSTANFNKGLVASIAKNGAGTVTYTFTAKANIKLHIDLQCGDSVYKSNKADQTYVAKVNGTAATEGDIVSTARDTRNKKTYTLNKDDVLTLTYTNATTGDIRTWFFAAEAEVATTSPASAASVAQVANLPAQTQTSSEDNEAPQIS